MPTKMSDPKICIVVLLALVVTCIAAPSAAAFQESAADSVMAGQLSEIAQDKPYRSAPGENPAGDQTRQAHAAASGDETVERLINPRPKNEHLYHIGPAFQDDEPDAADSQTAGPNNLASAQDGDVDKFLNSESKIAGDEVASPEDEWIQMDIDQNGTYLLFGEGNGAEDMLLNPTEMERLFDTGVGVGKKWHF